MQKEDPVVLTIVQMATAAAIGYIIVVMKGEASFTVEPSGLLKLLYLEVFSTTLAFMQIIAQKYITETKAAIILSIESLWGTLFSILVLNELITGRRIVRAVLISEDKNWL